MVVFGFNLPFGKMVVRADGKEERPPRIVGIGIGWSRSEFTRTMKTGELNRHEQAESEDSGH